MTVQGKTYWFSAVLDPVKNAKETVLPKSLPTSKP